ncbi:DNA-directed RNA polymerase subunit beta [Sporosarcina sp. 179-K 3D1 HS]|uniref:DNA-directed RNA polymerase subunit beta n=1 Tax=Sporosarcina sp. 179-K 3D1 HS TaxID=3232169 RepID=UPI0039A21156
MTDEKRNGSNRVKRERLETEAPAKRSLRASRHERKKIEEPEQASETRKWVQIRILPIWLRIILVLLLLAGAAILGAMIGYGYLGDGQPSDVLKKETWTHIFDIMNGKES